MTRASWQGCVNPLHWCGSRQVDCRHQVEPAPAEMVQRYGAEATSYGFVSNLRSPEARNSSNERCV
jgi:hypothetical protein